jgi:hypothetical protein
VTTARVKNWLGSLSTRWEEFRASFNRPTKACVGGQPNGTFDGVSFFIPDRGIARMIKEGHLGPESLAMEIANNDDYLPNVPVWRRRGRIELRLTNRLRKANATGRQVARYERAHTPGQQVGALTHLASIPKAIGHAVKRGCSGGLTQAARSLGYVREGEWRPDGR